MSTEKRSFVLSAPIEAAARAVRRALVADGWRIAEDDGASFLARQRYGYVTILLQRRANVAIALRAKGKRATEAEVNGELFGLGPYPRWRLRVTLDGLRAAIDRALGEEPPSEVDP